MGGPAVTATLPARLFFCCCFLRMSLCDVFRSYCSGVITIIVTALITVVSQSAAISQRTEPVTQGESRLDAAAWTQQTCRLRSWWFLMPRWNEAQSDVNAGSNLRGQYYCFFTSSSLEQLWIFAAEWNFSSKDLIRMLKIQAIFCFPSGPRHTWAHLAI